MCKKDIEKQNYKDEMFIVMKKRGYTTQEIKYTMKLDFYMKSAKDLDCDSNTKKNCNERKLKCYLDIKLE